MGLNLSHRAFFLPPLVLLFAGCGLFSPKAPLTPEQQALATMRANAQKTPQTVLQAPPTNKAAIYTSLGLAYLQDGHPRAAVQQLQLAIKEPGSHVDAYNVLGLAYQSLGQADLAREAFRHALDDGGQHNPEVLNNYGAFLLAQRDYGAAVKVLQEAVKDPMYSTPQFAWTNLAGAYRGLKDNEKARAALGRALYFKPGYPPALLLWADMDLADGDVHGAQDHVQGVLAQEPDNAYALLLAGRIALQTGHPQEGREYLQRSVNASPYSSAGKAAQSLLLKDGHEP